MRARSESEERLLTGNLEDWIEEKKRKTNSDGCCEAQGFPEKTKQEKNQNKETEEAEEEEDNNDLVAQLDKEEKEEKEHSYKMMELAREFVKNAMPSMIYEHLENKHTRVLFSITRSEGFCPVKATKGAVGFDLICPFDHELFPDEKIVIPFYVRLHFKHFGMYAKICARSGLSSKDSIELLGSGIIDPDYEGEIAAPFQNTSKTGNIFFFRRGMRIAQLIFFPFHAVDLRPATQYEEEKLMEYKAANNYVEGRVRGNGAFGSTGYK